MRSLIYRIPTAEAFLGLLVGCATAPALTPVKNPIPPAPPGVHDISEVTVVPRATRQVRPRYPAELRAAGVAGEAVVLFTVRKDGIVTDTSVVTATDRRFGAAAVEAVEKWQFAPASLGGAAVDCRLMVPIVFDYR